MWCRIAFPTLLGVWLALFPHFGSAQEERIGSEVTIVVIDQGGAGVAHANVGINSDPAGPSRMQSLSADDAGRLLVKLEAGEYDVTAHATGFRTVRRHVVVQSGTSESVLLVLNVDSCSPCVTLQAEAPAPKAALLPDQIPVPESKVKAIAEPTVSSNRKQRSLKCLYLWRCACRQSSVTK
jgi:hypothetical protein